jgi:pyruvate formate lyase activating enzyme
VTNGYIEEKPLMRLLPFVDAMNIDLKSAQEEFYHRLCKAHLEPVQRTIRIAHEAGTHVEIAHLVVTGWNDREESVESLSRWIGSVNTEIPLHLTRYFPHYRYNQPPTSENFLRSALEIARRELKFVYLGNMAGEAGADTLCPNCGTLLVARRGYHIDIQGLSGDICAQCGRKLPFRV